MVVWYIVYQKSLCNRNHFKPGTKGGGKVTLSSRHSAFACLMLCACEQPRAAVTHDAGTLAASACANSAAAFRGVIAEFQSRQQNAAISVGVRHRGRTVFREATGFANRETGLAADAAMPFSIASITKAFRAAALLKLVEAHRVDAEIQRYVPDLPRHPSGRPVTVRMLAHHVGAVRHWGPERDDRLYARHFGDVHEILDLFRENPWVPGLAPLTRYSYSSYGSNTLAMAIRSAAGMSYQEFLSRQVLRPLGLKAVRFDRPGLGGKRRASRYSWYDLSDFHELTRAPQLVPDWDYSHNMAGGGLLVLLGHKRTFCCRIVLWDHASRRQAHKRDASRHI
jgi:CubicO group peptidase (beta-lactamase class C family)